MNYKIIPLAAIPLLAAASVSHADALGFSIGANVWQQSFEGTVLSSSDESNTIDLEDDLDYGDENSTNFYIAFEHPIPILPNIRLAQTEIEVDEATQFNRAISFEGTSYAVNEPITSTSDLSHTDATLYYEVLDNWISLDLGLTARVFSEGFEVSSNSTSSDFDLDETLPMVYLAVKVELPLTGLYAGANGNFISYDGSSVTDYSINLGYETELGLGVEAGFRSFDIDYDDDDEVADITIDGSYIGLFYHF
ncbi:TIGR04219 family outer membrane beta-barrel protein [Oceanicoccus sp. KOV_DT_Chl]|uniref:TIGR04219 family outer membrane beta-barrel protein n=1 Tax=Oceanicoccus sp. KOV_DT_Chl TaxID=1904639 RepID=UPI000C7C1B55|nr:TIGR04219 family outer membrane beta-barrel protein [Oceanicoccus sp. KOV_DT_Chl]